MINPAVQDQAVPEAADQNDPLPLLAHQIAEQHTVTQGPGKEASFMGRIDQYKKRLRDAYQRFSRASREELNLSYAAEWMLDNFYVIQQTVRQIHEDLPGSFYRELPKLESGPLAGYPSAFAVSLQFIG